MVRPRQAGAIIVRFSFFAPQNYS